MALCSAGDHVVASAGLFGATQQLLGNIMPRFGVQTTFVAQTDVAAWEAAIRPETKLFFLETPSNPLTAIADVRALVAVAHARGILVVVDNCFCTPILQRPLDLGADLVVHSATKYLNGHSDVVAGLAVVGDNPTLAEKLGYLQNAVGGVLDPFSSFLTLRGIRTLSLRIERHSSNALALAQWLEQQPAVDKVYYPGLPSHPQHELARRQMRGYGGVISFELATDLAGTEDDDLHCCAPGRRRAAQVGVSRRRCRGACPR